MLLIPVALVAALFAAIFSGLKTSWAYTEGVDLARHNPAVVQALGEPIESGWLVQGHINFVNDNADADLAIPLSGPRGSGTLYVVAKKKDGQWHFERAEVEISGGKEKIDLLAKEKKKKAA